MIRPYQSVAKTPSEQELRVGAVPGEGAALGLEPTATSPGLHDLSELLLSEPWLPHPCNGSSTAAHSVGRGQSW